MRLCRDCKYARILGPYADQYMSTGADSTCTHPNAAREPVHGFPVVSMREMRAYGGATNRSLCGAEASLFVEKPPAVAPVLVEDVRAEEPRTADFFDWLSGWFH